MPVEGINAVSASTNVSSGGGLLAILFGGVMWLIYVVILVLMIVAMFKLFAKAGKPGWTAIIPILNVLQLLDIAGKPWWWIILMCIPIVDIVILFIVSIAVAKAYGKGAGFGICLVIFAPIFYLILGFGSAHYQRPADFSPTWLNI
ncbi:MAG: DUF5684 domain-containing protein [Coriobacteriia bacterium]|nr:DUF5684 domain-containing protein [Coriobacteriia bacterium]